MPTCRLCNQEKKLIKAHVIPEAFFTLPDPGKDAAKILSLSGAHPKKTRTGVYDENILCSECDGKLGGLDQYAAEVLLQKGPTREEQLKKGEPLGRYYEGADPEKLKAFAASVAWRAHHSCHPFFLVVQLGPYATTIREALLEGKSYDGIDVVLSEFNKDDGSILNPHRTRFDEVRFWLIYTSRFTFYVKVDQGAVQPPLDAFVLKKGREVASIVRTWKDSQEYSAIATIAKRNRNAFRG